MAEVEVVVTTTDDDDPLLLLLSTTKVMLLRQRINQSITPTDGGFVVAGGQWR